jgi:hypothetical protein
MNKKLFDALETCLQAIEKGETMDSALARFSEFQAELRPLLEASLHARTLRGSQPSDAAQRRGRARLLQRAAEMREQNRKPKRTWLYNFRPLAVTLAVLTIFFASTGLVRASSGALPGDGLYPVKRTWEGVQLLFTFDTMEREGLELEHENERLHEINELLAKGREEPVSFSGYVTAQDGDLWMVAGVPVRISSQTRLPGNAVVTGTGVKIVGRTDAQGFLIAQSVDILPAGTIIPPIDDDSHEKEGENDDDDDGTRNPLLPLETPTALPTLIGGETETPTPAGTVIITETETETESGNNNENETEQEHEEEKEEESEIED